LVEIFAELWRLATAWPVVRRFECEGERRQPLVFFPELAIS